MPWVKLVWDNYYQGGRLPGQQKKGSFWWRDIVKLMDQYMGIASVQVGNGTTVLFWKDSFYGSPLKLVFPELFSFVKESNILFIQVKETEFTKKFHLPLSMEEFGHQRKQ